MLKETELKKKLKLLPDTPGVYIFKNEAGKVIYVCKAKSIKKRVPQYFTKPPSTPKISLIAEKLHDIDYIVTSSELEAMILESNLIKKFRPRYNVILRDDKQYPYLKLTVNEEWPRLIVVRRMEVDGARYFGPFSGGMVRETIKLIKRLFPIRWCKETPLKIRKQPCMYFARLIERMTEEQKVISSDLRDRDVIACGRAGDRAAAVILQIRKGKLVGKEIFYPTESKGVSDEELMGSIVTQYYADAATIPPEIVLQHEVEGPAMLEEWLKAKIDVPKKGKKRKLVEMAEENAKILLERNILSQAGEAEGSSISALKEKLDLPILPVRIEAFDVSNISGTSIVGSMVAFSSGSPLKSDYRRFEVRSVKKPDDVSSIYEIVKRRYTGSLRKELGLPDLILIDGGIGQVRAGSLALKEAGLPHIPIIGLAKKFEDIYLPGRTSPLKLPKGSKALHLLQRVRDEAHRFALAYHKLKRKKDLFQD
ncbi:MAG: excinuclease ABC subunit UvrC [Candidatus Saganbacteria bacterium]|nr:excinuclease ABC subunit UvrC [Candidatus Saganbacteria bacterium]